MANSRINSASVFDKGGGKSVGAPLSVDLILFSQGNPFGGQL
jgi:hypothetical protein